MRTGFWEILLIVILILVLFGHAKIPEIMKNFADGIKVFKKELKTDDSKTKPASKKSVAKKVSGKSVKKK